jgi:hypothetical protein
MLFALPPEEKQLYLRRNQLFTAKFLKRKKIEFPLN